MDDLSTPLGQSRPSTKTAKLPWRLRLKPLPALAGLLMLFLAGFVAVAIFNKDPFGGEPMARIAITPPAETDKAAKTDPAATPEPAIKSATPSGSERRITIIDGSSGKRQEVVVPDKDPTAAAPAASGGDQSLLEDGRHGALPIIGASGLKPAKAYAAAAPAAATGLPSVAIVVTGLGIGAAKTADAIAKLPGPVTLAFTPYGSDPSAAVTRARAQGHEVLLQVPLEPFDYPDNDPGPQTLLAEAPPEQNLDRLHFHMSRFQGYVGIANYMGARFQATDAALKPVMQDIAKRGLIYFDDGSAPRSASRPAAEREAVPQATADIAIDTVPSPAEIDRALAKLEGIARQRGAAIGVATALPASIERIAAWAKTLGGKGMALVPLTAALPRAKSS